jgi:membrane-anchored glycerophosphoryl diester phosphodiesterase (GDPDase)
MIRRQASTGDLFIGFRQYWAILLAFLIILVISYSLSLPFAIPQYVYLFGDFPLDRIATSSWEELFKEWFESYSKKAADPFSTERLGTSLIGYLYYPIAMYLNGRFLLIYPLIVIRKVPAIEAIKTSWSVTAPYHWWLLLLNGLGGIVAPMGILACCVGILFTFPFSLLLQGSAIFQLFGEDKPARSEAPDIG